VLLHGRVEPLRQAALARGLAPLEWSIPRSSFSIRGACRARRIVPVYTKPAGISAGAIRRVVHSAVDAYAARVRARFRRRSRACAASPISRRRYATSTSPRLTPTSTP